MSEECDALLERMQTYLDGECPKDVEAAVAMHLESCPPCLDRADFEMKVRALIAAKCRDTPPAGLMESIRARLQLG
ncbi:MAG TPA: mycothiol system anti-sigma-R factor [Euzebya sp.]|nr:mycothiol system anti-sigma-R factor [Euzebya sp.]